MKITESEHDQIAEATREFLKKLDSLGVSSALVSYSCDIEDIGWISEWDCMGDPRACDGLAWDYLHGGEDDGDFVFLCDDDNSPGF